MFEKFMMNNAADFSQRYRGTYGFFTRNNQHTLVRITEINRDAVHFVDKYDLRYILKADSEDNIGFTFLTPRSAYYNTSYGIPYLVRRVAAKQYSRGICDKNTNIEYMNGENMRVNFENLETIFGEKLPLHVALDAFKANPRGKGKGVALSSQIAYNHSAGKLKVFNLAVADADMSFPKDGHPIIKAFISKANLDLWGQELRDAARRASIKLDLETV